MSDSNQMTMSELLDVTMSEMEAVELDNRLDPCRIEQELQDSTVSWFISYGTR